MKQLVLFIGLLLTVCGCIVNAQTRSVVVDNNGIISGPTNFTSTYIGAFLVGSTNQGSALDILGIETNGIIGSVDTNQFTFEDNKLAIKSGVSLTNANAYESFTFTGSNGVFSCYPGVNITNYGGVRVKSGGNSGLWLGTAHVINGNAGDVEILGGTSAYGTGGSVSVLAGDSLFGVGGNVYISAKSSLDTDNSGGNVVITTGNTSAQYGRAGDIILRTGTNVFGTDKFDGVVAISGNLVQSNGTATFGSNVIVGGDITFERTPEVTIDSSYQFFLKISSLASDLLYLPSRGPNGDAEIIVQYSGLLFVDATTNNVVCKINPENLTAGGLSTYSASVKIVRVDSSTNTVTVENYLKAYGMTIDGLPSVEIKPLCGAEFVPLAAGEQLNLKSSLNNSMCLPTWMDVTVGAFVLGQGVATPAKVDAYPGAPYKVYAFDDTDIAYFTLQTQHKLAVTNVWFPELIYDRHLHVKLTDTPSAGQSNITVAVDYRLAKPNGTFESLVSMTNTVTLAATNTHYMVDWGTITNNNLSGASSVIIEGGVRRISGGDGDITDNVVCFESLDFHFPFEVPLGSNNRTGDQ